MQDNKENIQQLAQRWNQLFYQYYPYIADSLQIEKSATASHQLGYLHCNVICKHLSITIAG